jgi:alcohol dehydrogenase class IV
MSDVLRTFVYSQLRSRVIFGRGSIERLAEEADRLGLKRVAVLSTAQQATAADDITRQIRGQICRPFCGAAMHTPVEVTEEALTLVQ